METCVSAKQGVRVRMLLTDCSGTAIDSFSVSAIRYTVYHVYLGQWTAVSGHTDVSVDVTSVTDVGTDEHSGDDYNFEHCISMQESDPFPERGSTYRVEYVFYDANGEASVPTEPLIFTT